MHIAQVIEVKPTSRTPENTLVGIPYTKLLGMRETPRQPRDKAGTRRSLRTKKNLARTTDKMNKYMKVIAMIDHNEVPKPGMSPISISVTFDLHTL